MKLSIETEFNTLYQGEGKKKWNYNTDIGIAVEKLRQVIESISEVIYKELFKVALAAILLDVSNLYRNGKCLSYKKKWEDRKIVENDTSNVNNELLENTLPAPAYGHSENPRPKQDVVPIDIVPERFPVQHTPYLDNPHTLEIILGSATIRVTNETDPQLLSRTLQILKGSLC